MMLTGTIMMLVMCRMLGFTGGTALPGHAKDK